MHHAKLSKSTRKMYVHYVDTSYDRSKVASQWENNAPAHIITTA